MSLGDILALKNRAQLADIVRLPLSRFANKMLSGQNVKISFIGDSILEGNTVTTPGTDDCASVVCAELTKRFGVTVTKNNLALSGDRAYCALIGANKFEKAITDASDLIVISFGHNDIRSDMNTPGTGYPKAGYIATIEYMVRRIRRELPNCDIVLMTESPYPSAYGSNPYLVAQNVLLLELANRYNVAFADGYTEFTAVGDWLPYLVEGDSHPNSLGHGLLAKSILDLFDTTDYSNALSNIRPLIPAPIYDKTKKFIRASYVDTQSEVAYADINTPRYRKVGTWVGSATTTAGSYANCLFWGEECFIEVVTGEGNGIVDIYVDQDLIYDNFDLSAITAGTPQYLPIPLTHEAVHSVTVECVSGTLDFRGFACKKSNVQRIGNTDARLTFNEYWGVAGFSANAFLYDNRSSNNIASQVEFDFYGTGLVIESVLTNAADRGVQVTIDGGTPISKYFTGADKLNIYSGIPLVSGLAYGKHHAVIKSLTSNTVTISGFGILDGIVSP